MDTRNPDGYAVGYHSSDETHVHVALNRDELFDVALYNLDDDGGKALAESRRALDGIVKRANVGLAVETVRPAIEATVAKLRALDADDGEAQALADFIDRDIDGAPLSPAERQGSQSDDGSAEVYMVTTDGSTTPSVHYTRESVLRQFDPEDRPSVIGALDTADAGAVGDLGDDYAVRKVSVFG